MIKKEKMRRRQANRSKEPAQPRAVDIDSWNPRTSLGKKVKNREITHIDEILDNNLRIMESTIVDVLMPHMQTDLLMIGQSKGKFGGGQRRVFRQTQKKTKEGNKPRFATIAVIGNNDGYVGIGYGKSKETVPAREKAIRNAKLNIIKIVRGNGSWEDNSIEPTSIPYVVEGKCGSVRVRLLPAPRGTGLKVEKECAKILKMAGIQDVWSQRFGKTGTKINLIYALVDALKKMSQVKVTKQVREKIGMIEGSIST